MLVMEGHWNLIHTLLYTISILNLLPIPYTTPILNPRQLHPISHGNYVQGQGSLLEVVFYDWVNCVRIVQYEERQSQYVHVQHVSK